MNGNITFLLSLSSVFPFLAGLVRYRSVHKNYRPFLLYVMLSFVTEVLSYILNRIYHTNLVLLNVFSLLECIVLFTQFYKWGFIRRSRFYYSFLAIIFIAWMIENLLISEIHVNNRIFLISYSFLLVLLSIREINQAMMLSNRLLFKNGRLIICIGIIFYFTLTVISETFRFFLPGTSYIFNTKVFSISAYSNVVANLIYAVGIFYFPKQTNQDDFFYADS